jgi:outer membrane protein OmpA-like peptidoglycan-associated protein
MHRRRLRKHGLEGGAFVVLSDILINTVFLLTIALIAVAIKMAPAALAHPAGAPPPRLFKPHPALNSSTQTNQPISETVQNGVTDDKYGNGFERITILESLLFDKASWDLKPTAYSALDSAAATIQSRQATHHLFHIIVEGHTDSEHMKPNLVNKVGDDWGLSSARSLVVLRYLEAKNLPSSELVAVARGSSDQLPDASHSNREANNAQNRRVEIILSDKPGDLWTK